MIYVKYPSDFNDYAWELSSKGYFEVRAVVNDKEVNVSFYDSHRFEQDKMIAEELGEELRVENLIIVETVNREQMDIAIKVFKV